MSNLKRQDEREAKSVVKANVDIKDAWLEDGYGYKKKILRGTPLNHPFDYLNGKIVYTSTIQKVDGNIVETRNTIYNVLNWLDNEGIQKAQDSQLELF